ncbi:MAG: hypothetical protein ACOC1K_01150 [Nanoarchaeota archaeon]
MNRIIYDKFLEKLKEIDIKIYAYLVEGRPKEIKNNVLFIMYPKTKEFHKEKAEEDKEKILKIMNSFLEEKIEDINFYIKGERIKKIEKELNGKIIKYDKKVLKNILKEEEKNG